MLLRRTATLTAPVLAQASQSPGSFLHVHARGRRTWTLSLRDGHALQHRLLRVGPALVHLGPDPHAARSRDSSGFEIPPCGRSNRPNAAAEHLYGSARADGGGRLHFRQPLAGVERRHISGGQAAWSAPFTPNDLMQIRASSTAAAAKKSEERAADGDKGDEQKTKEAAAAERAPTEPEPEGRKPNKTQQLKKVFKEYGAVGVSFHIGISLMSLGMFYLLLSSGIDMTALLCRLGFSEAVVQSKMAAGTSTFVLAYAVHKLFAPVRISITLVSVPLIVRYLRKTGLFKPPTPAP
ncbi:protein FAM210B, mitochondrial [Betta splendens]|uniref:Protein FAM210B, mitochondrial n=1 Tax=Betta splendens TaxID=158456 RepID=A0A9W2XUR1_BETSP|nr:protein FAM210B, mitochondrial [Betta splendens]